VFSRLHAARDPLSHPYEEQIQMTLHVDFGRTADDYAEHRSGFPPELIHRLLEDCGFREANLDVGTGTGTLARQLAKIGAKVSAIDISSELLDQARALDAKTGVSVSYQIGRAEELPFSEASQDVLIAGQAHPARSRPSRELRRETRRRVVESLT
jgi:2-polyprenyl-3-methyl-5-hydroxy-6-metoxy-1,4-benzoquinol methylase